MEEKNRKLLCAKCKHKWKQRIKNKPKLCPYCKSPNWYKINNDDIMRLIIGR